MKRTRRGLLGAGAGIAAGLGGCLDISGVEYSDADTPAESSAVSATDGDEPEDADAFDAADDPHNPDLAAATREVFADLRWFAESYNAAVSDYREAVGAVASAAADAHETVEETGEPTDDQVAAIEAAGEAAIETVNDVLVPHFDNRSRLRYLVNDHVTVLDRFVARDDADRFLEELRRTRSSFASVGTAMYTDRRFSRNPIHNHRLLRRLVPRAPDDRFVSLRFDDDALETFAYDPSVEEDGERPVSLYGNGMDDAAVDRFLDQLGPVVQHEDREAGLLVDVAIRPDRDEGFEGWPRDLDGVPLYVQRYPNAETAAERLDRITAAATTADREPIGVDEDVRWHRLYHDHAPGGREAFDEHEGVQYGYVVRAEEFLFATGFSGDAWEERTGWRGPLIDAWALQ
ncbi:hypothetical protein [Halorubrum gandharaense]